MPLFSGRNDAILQLSGMPQRFRHFLADPSLWVPDNLSPAIDECGSDDRSAKHNTPEDEAQEVQYLWHPLYGKQVFVRARRQRRGTEVYHCYLAGSRLEKCFEIAAWMLDRAHCSRLRLQAEPEVHLEALLELQELLTTAAAGVVKRSDSGEITAKKGANPDYVQEEDRVRSSASQPLRSTSAKARVGKAAAGNPGRSDAVIDRTARQSGGQAAAVPRRAQ